MTLGLPESFSLSINLNGAEILIPCIFTTTVEGKLASVSYFLAFE